VPLHRIGAIDARAVKKNTTRVLRTELTGADHNLNNSGNNNSS